MKPIEMPAFRLTSDCIWNSFQNSNKRHLILTGAKKAGKTTLLSELIKMKILPDGFHTLGVSALRRCAEMDSPWISIDEIGYLDTQCPEYCDEIRKLMRQKRLIAVVRKQQLPFWEELCCREDVFLVDLDQPFDRLGCVIMASGLGKRFGSNKLMADFQGKPLVQWILDSTKEIFTRRVVVTRHEEVVDLCRQQDIHVIYHDRPYRSDTVRLGLESIAEQIDGCMFCPADQPLLRPDTIASLALNAVNDKKMIWRTACKEMTGAPVLFPKWAFPELLALPEGKGGGILIKKYPEQVRSILVRDMYELKDIDTSDDLRYLSEL